MSLPAPPGHTVVAACPDLWHVASQVTLEIHIVYPGFVRAVEPSLVQPDSVVSGLVTETLGLSESFPQSL